VISLQKPRPRVLDKRQAAKDKAANWSRVCRLVKARDRHCRVCKSAPGEHAHHIVYRSHGGKDVPSNLLWVCGQCHQDIHAKVTLVKFLPINPSLTATFERNTTWDKETA